MPTVIVCVSECLFVLIECLYIKCNNQLFLKSYLEMCSLVTSIINGKIILLRILGGIVSTVPCSLQSIQHRYSMISKAVLITYPQITY